jgi:hypothetical protein
MGIICGPKVVAHAAYSQKPNSFGGQGRRGSEWAVDKHDHAQIAVFVYTVARARGGVRYTSGFTCNKQARGEAHFGLHCAWNSHVYKHTALFPRRTASAPLCTVQLPQYRMCRLPKLLRTVDSAHLGCNTTYV